MNQIFLKRALRALASLIATSFAASLFPCAASAGVFYPDGATTMHFAFEGSPNGDRPIVRAPAFYHADDGFGFVDSPELIGTQRGVTAPKYFRFDVNLPAGNYDVAVTIGNDQVETTTTIKAEGAPTLVVNVHAAGGARVQPVVKTFTVEVKPGAIVKEGSPAAPLASDGRLNLEFSGTNPSMMKLDVYPHGAKPVSAAAPAGQAGGGRRGGRRGGAANPAATPIPAPTPAAAAPAQ